MPGAGRAGVPGVRARRTSPHSASSTAAPWATTRGAKRSKKVSWCRDGGSTEVTRSKTPISPSPSAHRRRTR